jgi:hypothetical protein
VFHNLNYLSAENSFFEVFAGQAVFSTFNNGMIRKAENRSSLREQPAHSDEIHAFRMISGNRGFKLRGFFFFPEA